MGISCPISPCPCTGDGPGRVKIATIARIVTTRPDPCCFGAGIFGGPGLPAFGTHDDLVFDDARTIVSLIHGVRSLVGLLWKTCAAPTHHAWSRAILAGTYDDLSIADDRGQMCLAARRFEMVLGRPKLLFSAEVSACRPGILLLSAAARLASPLRVLAGVMVESGI